jgi:hypothetical protein
VVLLLALSGAASAAALAASAAALLALLCCICKARASEAQSLSRCRSDLCVCHVTACSLPVPLWLPLTGPAGHPAAGTHVTGRSASAHTAGLTQPCAGLTCALMAASSRAPQCSSTPNSSSRHDAQWRGPSRRSTPNTRACSTEGSLQGADTAACAATPTRVTIKHARLYQASGSPPVIATSCWHVNTPHGAPGPCPASGAVQLYIGLACSPDQGC